MTTLESSSNRLSTPCFYRMGGARCLNGFLYHPEIEDELPADGMAYPKPVKLEGDPVQCPACEGKGRILTPEGRELMMFCQTFLRPYFYEMVEEAVEDKI